MPSPETTTPLIGITTYVEPARWGVWDLPAALVPQAYVRAVHAVGCRSLLVPPGEDGIEEIVEALGGLVLAGGPDLDPSLYSMPPHAATGGLRPDRDRGELALLRVALAHELPVLGICRGVELLNVALGGDLVQHLPDQLGADSHRGGAGKFAEHSVRVEPVAPVAEGWRAKTTVCSYHHQGLGRIADDLEPFAWAPDGIVEAVQHRGFPFVVGVLWHPEAGGDRRLFEALANAARDYRQQRRGACPENGAMEWVRPGLR
jgi:gamma-glutamyl-gamma-aminobutyrate hydrolase PuuD